MSASRPGWRAISRPPTGSATSSRQRESRLKTPQRVHIGVLMASKDGRPGAVRKTKKGPAKGTGGLGRRSLEGKGPTPKAEDRTYHAAGKRKIAKERLNQAQAKSGGRPSTAPAAGRKPKQKQADD